MPGAVPGAELGALSIHYSVSNATEFPVITSPSHDFFIGFCIALTNFVERNNSYLKQATMTMTMK